MARHAHGGRTLEKMLSSRPGTSSHNVAGAILHFFLLRVMRGIRSWTPFSLSRLSGFWCIIFPACLVAMMHFAFCSQTITDSQESVESRLGLHVLRHWF